LSIIQRVLDRKNSEPRGMLADWSYLDLDILTCDSKTWLRSFFFSGQEQRCTGDGYTFQNLPAVWLFIHGVSVASSISWKFRSLLQQAEFGSGA
jgi:hypothetical protein